MTPAEIVLLVGLLVIVGLLAWLIPSVDRCIELIGFIRIELQILRCGLERLERAAGIPPVRPGMPPGTMPVASQSIASPPQFGGEVKHAYEEAQPYCRLCGEPEHPKASHEYDPFVPPACCKHCGGGKDHAVHGGSVQTSAVENPAAIAALEKLDLNTVPGEWR